ncbi:MAG: hypothetical protein C0501_13550 [Isosphaera sp.]|nr:hypothetical protein [Isosphaera sp.]
MNPEWDESGYDALADAWVRATPDERDRMEAAVNRANRLLRDDPQGEGESRGGNVRVLIVPPLTFWYRVNPGGVARVFHVHHPRN